jgi:hypothetical protein
MEETKTILQMLHKEKEELIREKDVIETFRLKETFDKNRLHKEMEEREKMIQELEKEKRNIIR